VGRVQTCGLQEDNSLYIYITESLINLTRAKRIAGNGCHGHVHLSFESQEFEPVGGIL